MSMAQKVRAALSAAIEKHQVVVADLSGTTDMDLTFIQLLVSARKSADALGKTFLVNMPEGCAAAAQWKRAGLDLNLMSSAGAVK